MILIFRSQSGHRLMVVFIHYWGNWEGLYLSYVPQCCPWSSAERAVNLHICNTRQAAVRSARRGPWHQLQEQVDLLSATSGSLGSIISVDVDGIVLCCSYCDTMLIVLGSLWTCLCRSGSMVLCFEMLPVLMSGRNLVCLMEILMLRKEIK